MESPSFCHFSLKWPWLIKLLTGLLLEGTVLILPGGPHASRPIQRESASHIVFSPCMLLYRFDKLDFLTRRAALLRSLLGNMRVTKPFNNRVNWGGVFSLTVLTIIALADAYVSRSKARSERQTERIRSKPSGREYYALEGGV